MKSSALMTGLLATALCSVGCEGIFPAPDWEQMIRQRKALPFAASQWFPDGRAMQPPPENTVPRDRVVGDPALTEGFANGQYITKIPVAIDRALVESGHDAFDIYCATCHGLMGDGDSDVASNMDLRKPPSLISDQVRAFPPGRVFQVATKGYGLMPSYEHELSVRERWAVVAYLRALQLSQSARLDELRPDVRAAAERALAEESR